MFYDNLLRAYENWNILQLVKGSRVFEKKVRLYFSITSDIGRGPAWVFRHWGILENCGFAHQINLVMKGVMKAH